ncbi:MAG: LysM peptidoglycan-binding domain-containing protein [Vallitaleaceae bacterium]|nr:LysM peptidoglycan-binding domain-containing protein [Vallitaleaceae bacterium]
MINNMDQVERAKALPKNVRQIGDVLYGHRIYMEDYAYTYLHQYADKKEEQIAFLIGCQNMVEEESILLIKGAVEGKFLKREGAGVEITDETWQHALSLRDQYFEEDEIVGWVYTQPSYGVILTSALVKQHERYFHEEGQALFILDPVEKDEVFFEFEEGDLVQRSGFFVYYEKNPSMHEYMLDHKVVEEEELADLKIEDKAVKHYRAKELEKKEEVYHKKFVNMLFVLSGALMIMCIIIGVGLINNYEEMNQLKRSFSAVMEDYSTFKGEIRVPEKLQQDSLPTMQQIDEMPPGGTADEITEIVTAASNTEVVTEAATANETVETVLLPETYVVQPGDNLIKISYRFYATKDMVTSIKVINDIDNEDKIYIGQVLSMPRHP